MEHSPVAVVTHRSIAAQVSAHAVHAPAGLYTRAAGIRARVKARTSFLRVRSERVARARRSLRRASLHAQLAVSSLGPVVRRSIDVIASGLGLLCLAPLFLVAALATRYGSQGPIFFAQERCGQHGRRFRMWKFRTMVVDADALKDKLTKQHAAAVDGGVRFKMLRDPRVTRVGAVLRKFSIDELPQLFNILRGDMTLLGPRPAVWREVACYDKRALRRLEVKPGLTCLWQISGRSNLSFSQQIDLDLEYVDRTQPKDEVRILLATVPAVVTGRGAY